MEALLDDFARLSISSQAGHVRKPKPRHLCSWWRSFFGLLSFCILGLLYVKSAGQTVRSAKFPEAEPLFLQTAPARSSWLAAVPSVQPDTNVKSPQVCSALADPLQALLASLDSAEASTQQTSRPEESVLDAAMQLNVYAESADVDTADTEVKQAPAAASMVIQTAAAVGQPPLAQDVTSRAFDRETTFNRKMVSGPAQGSAPKSAPAHPLARGLAFPQLPLPGVAEAVADSFTPSGQQDAAMAELLQRQPELQQEFVSRLLSRSSEVQGASAATPVSSLSGVSLSVVPAIAKGICIVRLLFWRQAMLLLVAASWCVVAC